MDFSLTKEQQLIQKVAHDFAEATCEEQERTAQETGRVDKDIILQMGELGLLGLPISEEYGGAGAGYDSYVLAMEQLNRFPGPMGAIMASHVLGMSILETFGTEEQKKRWLPGGCSGESVFSYAFTEPGTGSDPKSVTCTARRDGDEWVLNGTKRFITSPNYEGTMGACFRDVESGKLATFFFDKFLPGYSVSEPWKKIACQTDPLYDVYFKDMRVPADALVGEIGDGFNHLVAGIGYGKTGIAASELGYAQSAYEIAVDYVLNKMHRDQPIAKFQGIQIQIAEMATKLETARLLIYKVASDATYNSKHNFNKFAKDAAMAKNYVSNAAVDITRHAMNVMGAYGLMEEYKLEELYRKVTFGVQVEGSPHMQDVIIANAIYAGF